MRSAFALSMLALVGCSAEHVSSSASPDIRAAVRSEAETNAVDREVAFNVDGAPTCEISVPGMMCAEGCGVTVQKALAGQPGVKDVKIDFDSKTAVVAFEEGEFDADAAVHLLEDEYGFAETSLKDVAAEADVSAETAHESAG